MGDDSSTVPKEVLVAGAAEGRASGAGEVGMAPEAVALQGLEPMEVGLQPQPCICAGGTPWGQGIGGWGHRQESEQKWDQVVPGSHVPVPGL